MIGQDTVTVLTVVLLSIASVSAQEMMQDREMVQTEEMMQDMADEGRDPTTRAGAHVSTLGLGVFVARDVSNAFAVRGMVNYFGRDLDRHEAGIQYEVDLQLQSVGLILDWHAFRNGFRLSGGAFLNQNEFAATAEGSDMEIGENEYNGLLDALVDFDGVAPYLGLGWNSGRGRSGLGFGIEAGVLFQGTPKLSASGMVTEGGITCDFSVSQNGNATVCPALGVLKADLEVEHRELDDELEGYQFYPVLSLSVSYRF
ncbi:MAG: hypothetical protein OXP66_01570 [Candidatus Tectomicrobia bacterium]|nr:hypothetical protein [Candidatus Tectomicrobia bacterium]